MNEIENAISNINYGLHYEDCGNMVVITKFSACQALWALEKQIPKKAEYYHKANGECALIICPNCENRLTVARYVFRLDGYCKECGQHYVVDIKDWSVEE